MTPVTELKLSEISPAPDNKDGEGNGYRDFGAKLRGYAASRAKQDHVELAIAFATHEEFLTGPWNGWDEHCAYLELLQQHGYEISPVEKKKIGRGLKRGV